MATRHLHRRRRVFQPVISLGLGEVALEARISAASIRKPPMLQPQSMLVVELTPSALSPAAQAFLAGVSDHPGFILTNEPGTWALSTGGLVADPPPPSDDTNDGTENPFINISGGTLPAGFTGQVTTSINTDNVLEADALGQPGVSITINMAMTQYISQDSPVVGPFPLAVGMTSNVGSGVSNGGAPVPISWSYVDRSRSGDPVWNTVQGNPPLYVYGYFSLSYNPFHATGTTSGAGGANVPAAGLPTVPTAPAPAMGATGIWFTSAATGVFIDGPVTDPATGDTFALQYIFPTVSGGTTVLSPPQYADGFFAPAAGLNGNTLTINYGALVTACGESINYTADLTTAFFTTPTPVGIPGGATSMNFTFYETAGVIN